jgi:predicted DNA-binding transcriptional regulator AlpA
MNPRLHRVYGKPELPAYTGLKRTQIEAEIKAGRFPPGVRVSERREVWLEPDLIKWQQDRITEREIALRDEKLKLEKQKQRGVVR